MVSEFELIRRHFTRPTAHTVLGVGDDAALMRIRPGMELAASTDMLVAGVHFLAGTDPRNLGWKALAVNVSDLAAMGAQPRWALLAAALPSPDEVWIAAFAEGLFACAHAHSIDIVGGDTTRGPLTINVSVFGEVPAGEALRRSGAHAGDDIWISGTPGTAALGLALRGLASAAIDVSDGLLADLGHIAECSALAAEVRDDWLPWAPLAGLTSDATLARECLLAGGDDYELAFTAAAGRRGEIEAAASRLGVTLTRIGRMQGGPAGSVVLVDAGGSPLPVVARGFDHFESAPE